MTTSRGMTITKGGRPITLEPDNTYYRKIAEQLVEFAAQTDCDEMGETMPLISDLTELLIGLKIPLSVVPKMRQKGFLVINEKDPDSFYVRVEGKKPEEIIPLDTRTLRKQVRRLMKFATISVSPDASTSNWLAESVIQKKLTIWGLNPDEVITQLEEKGYLLERKTSGEKSFYIFATQKESFTFIKRQMAS